VSTKYLLLVNLSVRKMRPAFVRKRMAVAVAFTGFAAAASLQFSNQEQGKMHLWALLS
jgi:hypothetical protein